MIDLHGHSTASDGRLTPEQLVTRALGRGFVHVWFAVAALMLIGFMGLAIDAGTAPELARVIAGAPKEDPGLFATLKWGIVTGTVGLGLIVVQFLPYRPDEPIVLGLLLVFTALGLLGYYASARRLLRATRSAGTA